MDNAVMEHSRGVSLLHNTVLAKAKEHFSTFDNTKRCNSLLLACKFVGLFTLKSVA